MSDPDYLHFSIPEIINLVTAYNLLIMFLILMVRKQNTPPNRVLAFIMILPAISYINNLILLNKIIYVFPSIVFIAQISALLVAPFIYQYVRLFLGKKKIHVLSWHSITILAICICIIYWFKLLLSDDNEKYQFAHQILNSKFPWYLIVARGVFFVLMSVYFIDITIQVWKYSKKQREINAGMEKIKLYYIQQFLILIWALNIAMLISYQLFSNFTVDFIIIPIITNIFYFFILVTSFNHAVIFNVKEFKDFEEAVYEAGHIEISKNNIKELNKEEIKTIQQNISELLYVKKIFTDPQINIVKFATELNQTVHQTSYFINNHLNTNFYNLINSKRIELAKLILLEKGTNAEIEVIGYEVGFNSKSAFYRAFNRYVHVSPSEFIKKHQEKNFV